MRQSLLWLLFFGAAPGPPAKAQLVDTVVYFPLPLMDLGIRATVREGVWIAGGPSLRSYQGADSSMYVLLQVHPDTLFSWAGHASVVLNRPLLTAEDERIQWTRELRAFRSPGSLRLGRTVKKGRLKGDRWLPWVTARTGGTSTCRATRQIRCCDSWLPSPLRPVRLTRLLRRHLTRTRWIHR